MKTVSKKTLSFKQLERKRKLWKLRFYLTVLFPVMAVVLSVETARVYVRIKMRDLGTSTPMPKEEMKKPAPVPVQAVPVQTEIVAPEPVQK